MLNQGMSELERNIIRSLNNHTLYFKFCDI